MRLLRDIALYGFISWLIIFGFGFYSKGEKALGLSLIAAGSLIGAAAFYLLKIRPFSEAQIVFHKHLGELGFVSVEEIEATSDLNSAGLKDLRRFISWLIRQHGDADFSVKVENLFIRDNLFGYCVAGQKYESGENLNFDFFVAGVLVKPEVRFAESGEISSTELSNTLISADIELPSSVRRAIDQCPFDYISRKGITFVLELEPREILDAGFSLNFRRLLSELGQLPE